MSDLPDEAAERPARPGQRTALLVLGAIGAILIGFAGGALVRMPLDRSPEPEPAAVDIGFCQDMSTHHAQAVEMAGIALIRSTDNDVRRLAYDILTTQQGQIGRMHGWLEQWGKPEQSVDGFMGWMTATRSDHDHAAAPTHSMSGPATTMPGMATADELAALRRASGLDGDVLFLQLMLRHHQGGVPMMEYAAKYAATTAVRTLATTMVNSQRNEMTLITGMLTARNAQPMPAN